MNETVKMICDWEMAAYKVQSTNQEKIKLKAGLTTKQTMHGMNIATS